MADLDERIRARQAAIPVEAAPQEGFFERVGDRLDERRLAGVDTLEAFFGSGLSPEFTADFRKQAPRSIGPLEATTQLLGTGAGGILDVAGEGVVSLGRGISAITPDVIEDPVVNAARRTASLLASTPPRPGCLEYNKSGPTGISDFQGSKPSNSEDHRGTW